MKTVAGILQGVFVGIFIDQLPIVIWSGKWWACILAFNAALAVVRWDVERTK